MGIKCKMVHKTGTYATLRVYWGGTDCPNAYGRGGKGVHNAHVFIAKNNIPDDETLGGSPEDYADDRWPTKWSTAPVGGELLVRVNAAV